jgi:hypothetical protein
VVSRCELWGIDAMSEYDERLKKWMQQPPQEAMQSFAGDVRDYVALVNKIAEVIRLSDDISKISLDTDLTVADLMLTLLRRGEKLNTLADVFHEYASRLDSE